MPQMIFATLWDTRHTFENTTHEPVAFNLDNISHMAVSGNTPYATRVFFRSPIMPWGAYVNVLETLPELYAQLDRPHQRIGDVEQTGGAWQPRTGYAE